MSDFTQAIKYARTLYQRSALALASSLYALFTFFGPSKEQYLNVDGAILPKLMILPEHYKILIAAIFALNAAGLWWRIFDAQPRVVWATIFNIMTAGLWLTLTVVSVFLYDAPWSDNVGEIILTLTALYTLTRTDYTQADRGSA